MFRRFPPTVPFLILLTATTWQTCWSVTNETNRYVQMMQSIVIIPPGDPIAGGEKRAYQVASPRDTNKRTLLFLEIRMDNPTFAGDNYGMSITLNGRDLGTARDWMSQRLIGKDPIAHVKNYPGAEGPWVRAGWWLLVYAPDFSDKQIEEGDDCLFLWDVTDMVRPDGKDEIQIKSQTKRLEEQLKHPVPLKIGRFQMGLVDEKELSPVVGSPLPVPPIASNAKLEGKGFSCWLAAGGGLVVKLGRESFLVRSRFSFPGQPKGGWNLLEPAPMATGEPTWKPTVRKNKDSITVTALGANYSLSRRLTVDQHRIMVHDTFRNLTDKIIGLKFFHEMDCTGKVVPDVAVCGDQNANAASTDRSADNPTLFVKVGQVGLGMLAEDDVYRVQSQVEFRYPIGSTGSSHFGLAPGASCTVDWSLYPTATGDAWDFINQVRRDWKVNVTIPAGSIWTDCSVLTRMSDADLKQYIEWSGGKWIMATPWLDTYPLPTRPTYEQIAETTRPVVEKLRRISPDAKLLLGTHPTMNFCPPGKFYDSDEYLDSFVLDEQRKHFWHPWYTSYFCVGIAKEQGFLNFCNFMTPTNSYFKKMMGEADFALDKAGVGGIYCDEFNHYNCLSSRTYGRWDQHYVDLDANTFEVKTDKQCALLGLVCDEAQQVYADHIMKKGAVFLANSEPVTRRMQGMNFPRFMETPSLSAGFHAALYSPLAYGNPPLPADEAGLFQYVRDRLMCCVLTHLGGMPKLTRPCVTARMFPFTPLDIRPGVLTGKERIVTAKSGTCGWAAPFKARLFEYDKAGILTEADPPVKTYPRKLQIIVSENGIVILERAE